MPLTEDPKLSWRYGTRHRAAIGVSEANPDCANPAAKRGGHIVFANCKRGAKRQGFIDTWDSGDMYVDAYMRVAKKESKDSPLHWKYDYDQHKFII